MSLTPTERALALSRVSQRCPRCGDDLEAHDDGLVAYVVCDSCGWMEGDSACQHRPSGEEDAVGAFCPCTEAPHSRQEKCALCGEWMMWHDFPGRELPFGAPAATRSGPAEALPFGPLGPLPKEGKPS